MPATAPSRPRAARHERSPVLLLWTPPVRSSGPFLSSSRLFRSGLSRFRIHSAHNITEAASESVPPAVLRKKIPPAAQCPPPPPPHPQGHYFSVRRVRDSEKRGISPDLPPSARHDRSLVSVAPDHVLSACRSCRSRVPLVRALGPPGRSAGPDHRLSRGGCGCTTVAWTPALPPPPRDVLERRRV